MIRWVSNKFEEKSILFWCDRLKLAPKIFRMGPHCSNVFIAVSFIRTWDTIHHFTKIDRNGKKRPWKNYMLHCCASILNCFIHHRRRKKKQHWSKPCQWQLVAARVRIASFHDWRIDEMYGTMFLFRNRIPTNYYCLIISRIQQQQQQQNWHKQRHCAKCEWIKWIQRNKRNEAMRVNENTNQQQQHTPKSDVLIFFFSFI